ncbi:MAG TPA: restriction endonuclease [bacterium]|nr:restriction endonuclease [bacterium]
MKNKPDAFTAYNWMLVTELHGSAAYFVGNEKNYEEVDDEMVDIYREFANDKQLRKWIQNEPEELFHNTWDSARERYLQLKKCKFCKAPLLKSNWQFKKDHMRYGDFEVLFCPTCAFWASGCRYAAYSKTWGWGWGFSTMRRFAHEIPEECANELAQYIRVHPDFLHSIDPKKFEILVRDVFRANRKAAEVIHVGGPNDQGVDVLYVDDEENEWLVQVKRRGKQRKSEPFSTIQSLAGALTIHGKLHGIVVSTAPHFSKLALSTVTSLLDQGMKIETVDKGILYRMLGNLLPSSPWRKFVEENTLGLDDDEWEALVGEIIESLRVDLEKQVAYMTSQ